MSSANLYHCFEQRLPRSSYRESSDLVQTRCSSTTVEEEEPPDILIAEEISPYIDLADDILENNIVELMNAAGVVTAKVTLRNESDVDACTQAVLLTPVLRVLEVDYRYNDQIERAGQRQVENLRVDVGILCKTEDGFEPIVLMEFKQAGFINKELFKRMLWNKADVDPKTFIPKVTDHTKDIDEQYSATLQLKQVKAYAARSDCKYVALCDYFTLILFKLNEDLTVVFTTIVEDQQFRKALLGFILAAVDEKQV